MGGGGCGEGWLGGGGLEVEGIPRIVSFLVEPPSDAEVSGKGAIAQVTAAKQKTSQDLITFITYGKRRWFP